MSHHVLHILSYGSYLHKERGSLIYENKQRQESKKIPIEDIKALVIAAKGVSLSDSLIGSLSKNDAVILHCDEAFRPVALTAPLHRVINREAAFTQAERNSAFHADLWHKILAVKVYNQAQVIKYLKQDHLYLLRNSESECINEAICARYYWRRYFGGYRFPSP